MQKFKMPTNCAHVLIASGAIALWAALFDGDWQADIRTVGAVLLISGIMRATTRAAVEKVMQPQADVYEAGVEQGYDNGYHDGRESIRPVLVHLRGEVSNTN